MGVRGEATTCTALRNYHRVFNLHLAVQHRGRLGGVSAIAAPTNAWLQYGVKVPGDNFLSTVHIKAFRAGMNSDGWRILDMAEV